MEPDSRPSSRGRGHPGGPAPRLRRSLLLLLPAAVLLPAGCRNLGKSDDRYELLTAELRTRERELIEARAERDRLRLLAEAYQRQLQYQQSDPAYHPGTGGAPTLPVQAVSLGAGTGGLDDDRDPGDEALQVVIVPRDDDGAAVKVPARAAVAAFEISREGVKTPIGRWEVSPDQLRRAWRGGLLSSGYFVTLQWDKPPGTDRLRVAVRLTTLDGRAFEADKDVSVKPLPGVSPAGPLAIPPPAVPERPPGRPPGPEELPPPPGLPEPAARLRPPKPLP